MEITTGQEQQEQEETKSADELWAQVEQDRATRAAGADSQPTHQESGAEDDPLASLPEPTRRLIQEMDEKVRKANEQVALLDKKLGTANGTIGNLKQWHDESQAKLKAVEPIIDASIAAKKAADEAAEAEREQRRIAARTAIEEFSPEFAEYVDIAVADIKGSIPKAEQQESHVSAQAREVEDVQIMKLMLELSDLAPGWRATSTTQEFKSWLSSQPKDLQDIAAYSRDVNECASVFKSFDEHKKAAAQIAQVEKERKDRLSRGSSIQGRGSSVGNVDLSTDAAWEKVKRDREKARAQS